MIYSSTAEFLSDNALLAAHHWSSEHAAYLDFGLHSEAVRLESPKPTPQQRQAGVRPEMVRAVKQEPRLGYVPQIGYVSEY